jgi:hypothetical protein
MTSPPAFFLGNSPVRIFIIKGLWEKYGFLRKIRDFSRFFPDVRLDCQTIA